MLPMCAAAKLLRPAGGLRRHGLSTGIASALLGLLCLIAPPLSPAPAWGQPPSPPVPTTAPEQSTPDQQPAAASTLNVFDVLPGEADLAIVFDNAAEFRQTGLVDSTISLLDPEGILGPIRKAWPELAAQLGWTSEEAFDALLGTRVVLTIVSETPVQVAKGGKARRAAADSWALLSRITPEAERRLMRLPAATRGLVEGHQILALPDGKFYYTLHHPRPAAGKAAAHDNLDTGGWIVIAPAERKWLMYSVIARLRAHDRGLPPPAVALAETARAAIERLPGPLGSESPVQVLLRLDADRHAAPTPPPTQPNLEWRDFLALTARSETIDDTLGGGTRWRLDALLRETGQARQLAQQPSFSDRPLRVMTGYAPLAAVLQGPMTRPTGPAAQSPHADHPHAGAITKAESTITGVLTSLGLDPARAGAAQGRQALLIEAIPVEGEAPMPSPAITLAIEMGFAGRDADARAAGFAARMDAGMARLVSTLEQRFGAAAAPPPRDFAGVFPEAPRVLPLNFETGNPIAMLFGGRPVLCWSYPRHEPPIDDADTPPHVQGLWWAITAARHEPAAAAADATTPAGFHQRAVDALNAADTDDSETDRWLSLGFVQPSALKPLVPAFLIGTDDEGWQPALTRCRLIEWRTRATADGDIACEAGIVIDAAEPAPTEAEADPSVKKK